MQISFASRVLVYANGSLVYSTHAERAARLMQEGAIVQRKSKKGKVFELSVATFASRPPKPPTAPSLSMYMGQKYTITERTKNAAGEIDGRVCQYKWINPGDRPLFVLAVTDCMRAA